MESISVSGLTIYYDEQEREAAELVRAACEKSAALIQESWGLEPPGDCHVYVMTSWLRFPFRAAPLGWKVLLVLSLPLWALRYRRLWPHVGGYEQQFGDRHVVGVKPPRLIQAGQRGIGEQIFVPEADVGEKVQSVVCHELAHAFVSDLKPPNWLKEGLAMLTVDRYFEKPSVRQETLEVLERFAGRVRPRRNDGLQTGDQEAMVYQYVQGYWITRYIEETQPGLLKRLLGERREGVSLESEIAAAYNMETSAFWEGIDERVVAYFQPINE